MSKPVSPPSPTAVWSPAKPRAKPGESARAASLFLDNQLCFSLYATSRAMTKVYRPLLAPMGLTYPQNIVMLALWEHGELTAGGLGDCVALDSGTLVPLVRKLVSLGLLQRQRSASVALAVAAIAFPSGVWHRCPTHSSGPGRKANLLLAPDV